MDEKGHRAHVRLPGKWSMAMASDESVSASLIHRSDLPSTGIVAVEAVIDGENESIIVHCAGEQELRHGLTSARIRVAA